MTISRAPEDLISDLDADGRVTRTVFFCLDAAGQHIACEDPNQIEELADDLLPGFRIIRLEVRARPPQPQAVVVAAVTAPDPPDDPAHANVVDVTAGAGPLLANGTLLAASGGRLAGGESPEASS